MGFLCIESGGAFHGYLAVDQPDAFSGCLAVRIDAQGVFPGKEELVQACSKRLKLARLAHYQDIFSTASNANSRANV